MSKKQRSKPAVAVSADPIASYVREVKVVEDYKPIPREDEARPCSLCESRRPSGKSYSRVYCTKRQVRYCKCHYCGHTWSQERK